MVLNQNIRVLFNMEKETEKENAGMLIKVYILVILLMGRDKGKVY